MRSRSTALLSLAAAAALLLSGCASPSETEPTQAADEVAESSIDQPAAAGDRVGADGITLQVWSSTVPDDAAAATLGDPDEGSQWVTVNVAQWVTDEGLSDVDVAPVLRSTGDSSFSAEGVSPRAVEVPMTPDTTYTYAWSFQVPDDLVDAESLVLCVSDGDSGCSAIAG